MSYIRNSNITNMLEPFIEILSCSSSLKSDITYLNKLNKLKDRYETIRWLNKHEYPYTYNHEDNTLLTSLKTVNTKRSIYITHERIKSIPLLLLPAVESMLITESKMKRIENIHSLQTVNIINFRSNRITKIENLESFISLRNLCLMSNKITKIENLEGLVSLNSLDLSHNKISKIENLEHLIVLKKLNLSYNSIEKLENIFLKGLLCLHISCNGIRVVENLPTSLDFLYIESNRIKRIDSKCLISLNYICITRCSLYNHHDIDINRCTVRKNVNQIVEIV